METIEIKTVKSWKRDVIEYFEDLEIICNNYNRMFLRYLGKLNRLLHEERIVTNPNTMTLKKPC
jgi:hypothetical protein